MHIYLPFTGLYPKAAILNKGHIGPLAPLEGATHWKQLFTHNLIRFVTQLIQPCFGLYFFYTVFMFVSNNNKKELGIVDLKDASGSICTSINPQHEPFLITA